MKLNKRLRKALTIFLEEVVLVYFIIDWYTTNNYILTTIGIILFISLLVQDDIKLLLADHKIAYLINFIAEEVVIIHFLLKWVNGGNYFWSMLATLALLYVLFTEKVECDKQRRIDYLESQNDILINALKSCNCEMIDDEENLT